MQVYLPPGYATNRKRYSVLYLSHGGGGDDDTGWLVKGNAKAILDEAVAKDAMKPMIVMMPDARVGTDLRASPLADPFPGSSRRRSSRPSNAASATSAMAQTGR